MVQVLTSAATLAAGPSVPQFGRIQIDLPVGSSAQPLNASTLMG